MTVLSAIPDDTVQACRDRSNNGDIIEAYISAAYYVNGQGAPHYPPPAIPTKVVWFVFPDFGKPRILR